MRMKSNRRAKFRQYLTTWNRMKRIASTSEKKRSNIEAIDEAAREAFKE